MFRGASLPHARVTRLVLSADEKLGGAASAALP